MPERKPSHGTDTLATLLADLPAICRPARVPDEAWQFVQELSKRLLAVVPHDSMLLVWLAEDGRSFRVVAERRRELLVDHRERSERTEVAASALRAVFSGQRVAVPDAKADAAFANSTPFERTRVDAGARSWVAVPFVHDEQTHGALVLTRDGPHAFTDEHTTMLADVSARIGPFVEGALLLARAAEQDRRRLAFQAIHQALAGSLDVRKVFDGIVDAVRPIFGFDIMGVELMNPSGRTSEVIVEVGGAGQLPRIRNIDDFSVAPKLLSGEPVLVHDTHTECDKTRPGDRILLDAGIRTFVLVPLVFPLSNVEHATGVIYLAKRRPFWFYPLDIETLRGLADPVTLAIHHHRRVEQNRRIAAAEERTQQLQQRLAAMREELGTRYGFEHIIGRSQKLRDVIGRANKVAPTETTVLITGESGTGKELVAHAIHLASARADGPFLALNCAALPEALLESELFGHEKGAFTGALKRKPGRFELAAGGTLFLDEVGELALPVQAKLLRVLQQREYEMVGGTETLKADVRLLAATNRDLAVEVQKGRFREDLLYRLNVFLLHLPPLRERGDDVLVLAEHFVRELEARMGKSVPGISEEARAALLRYPWPGNIRELQNAIERALILSDGGLLQSSQLGLDLTRALPPVAAAPVAAAPVSSVFGPTTPVPAKPVPANEPGPTDTPSLSDWERKLVIEALAKAAGNKSRAAEILGVTRSQLYTRMKRFGLNP